jgi:hypothetical protein
MFATKSVFNYSTRKCSLILHKTQQYTVLVGKIVLFISYTTIARKSYSRTGCLLSAQYHVMSVRAIVKQTNQHSIGYRKIRTDQIPKYVNEVIFL